MKNRLFILFVAMALSSCAKQASPIVDNAVTLSTRTVELYGTRETSFVVSVPYGKSATVSYKDDITRNLCSCEYADKKTSMSGDNYFVFLKGLNDYVEYIQTGKLKIFIENTCVDSVSVVQYPPYVKNMLPDTVYQIDSLQNSTVEIPYLTNCNCSVSIDASWLEVYFSQSYSLETSNAMYVITKSVNRTGKPRDAKITLLAGNEKKSETAVFQIRQINSPVKTQ